jgi:hypothetical protein
MTRKGFLASVLALPFVAKALGREKGPEPPVGHAMSSWPIENADSHTAIVTTTTASTITTTHIVMGADTVDWISADWSYCL